ncbi:hypothetical protein IFVP22_C230076 [Vibrio parahaemolyticus]
MGSQGEKSVWTECEWRTGETQKVRRLGWEMLGTYAFSGVVLVCMRHCIS